MLRLVLTYVFIFFSTSSLSWAMTTGENKTKRPGLEPVLFDPSENSFLYATYSSGEDDGDTVIHRISEKGEKDLLSLQTGFYIKNNQIDYARAKKESGFKIVDATYLTEAKNFGENFKAGLAKITAPWDESDLVVKIAFPALLKIKPALRLVQAAKLCNFDFEMTGADYQEEDGPAWGGSGNVKLFTNVNGRKINILNFELITAIGGSKAVKILVCYEDSVSGSYLLKWLRGHDSDEGDMIPVELFQIIPGQVVKSRILNDEGYQAYKKNDYPAAIEKFQEAKKIDPKFLLAITNLASTLAKNSELDKSFEILQEAMALDPAQTIKKLTTDKDYDSLKKDSRYQKLIQSIPKKP
jgi:tetratricopeptide (TPR) repeat protein